jgi:hypothetical protein
MQRLRNRGELSAETRQFLSKRNHQGAAFLNDPSPLLDPARQQKVAEQLAAVCRVGGKVVAGRKRQSSRQSKTFVPELYAPPASAQFEKRAAERTFLMWLRVAWLEATGDRQTAMTAQAGSFMGPFARLVCDCLKRVGATDVDGVELINRSKRRHASDDAP